MHFIIFLILPPPYRLFDHSFHENTVLPQLRAEVEPDFREIDGATGITVKCGDTNCVFEFITYKYIGEVEKEPKTTTQGTNNEPLSNASDVPLQAAVHHPQSMPQYSNSDFTQESFNRSNSLPLRPLYTMEGPMKPGSTHNSKGPPTLERHATFDFSPHARSLKRQRTLEAAATTSSSSTTPNNDLQIHSSDSNRQEYTANGGGLTKTLLSSIDEDGNNDSTESSLLSPELVFGPPIDQ